MFDLFVRKLLSSLIFLNLTLFSFVVPALANDTAFFKKAEIELEEDWYILYRILERISRANNLDEHLWRVALIKDYEINAYAIEENLIAIPRGVLDIGKSGDINALACIIGHEIAHHTQEHKSQETAYHINRQREYKNRLQRAQEQSRRQEQSRESFQEGLDSLFGGDIDSRNIAGIVFKPQPSLRELTQNAEEALNNEILELRRKQELESDKYAYQYVVTAGFDPSGCMRVMDVLARQNASRIDNLSHPSVQQRKSQFNYLSKTLNLSKLVTDGKRSMACKKPLNYELDKRSGWLRVSTRFGSVNDAFNSLDGNFNTTNTRCN